MNRIVYLKPASVKEHSIFLPFALILVNFETWVSNITFSYLKILVTT